MSQGIKTSVDTDTDVFKGLGKLAVMHKITLKKDVNRLKHTARKVPVALRGRLQEELQCLQAMEVTERAEEPTDWVHSLVIVQKKSGSLTCVSNPRN